MLEVGFCGYNLRNADCGTIDRPGGSADYLLLLFHAPMTVESPDGKINAKAGDIYIFPPNTRHWYHAEKTFSNSFVHIMDLEGFIQKLSIPLNEIIRIADTSEINSVIKNIEYEFYNNTTYKKDRIDAYVRLLLTELAQKITPLSAQSHISQSLLRNFQTTRSIILSNLENEWTIKKMADLAHMSTSRFQHYYKIIFHQTPKADLIEARLEYSMQLLMEDELLVGEIARKIGYSNEFYYIKAFKKQYGLSPKQYALMKTGE